MTEHFSIGNFNLRNLVPGSTSDEAHFFYSASGKNAYFDDEKKGENLYQKKLDWIAEQLALMQAQIVAFQEVFDPQPLREALSRSVLGADAQLVIAGDVLTQTTSYHQRPAKIYRHPRVALALASEFRLKEHSAIVQFPDNFGFDREVVEKSGRRWILSLTDSGQAMNQFNRPVLRAVIRLPERFRREGAPTEMTVLVAHLKSKRPILRDQVPDTPAQALLEEQAIGQARSLVVRALEAAALRALALEELTQHPERPLFVLGDLNDGPRSVTTQIAGGLTPPRVHAGQASSREARAALTGAVGDCTLYSAYDLQTQRTHRDVFYTHIFDGHYDVLDHIFVSHHLLPHWLRERDSGQPNCAKIGTLRVFNDHLLNAELDDLHGAKVGRYLHTRSDHGQVVARVDWFTDD